MFAATIYIHKASSQQMVSNSIDNNNNTIRRAFNPVPGAAVKNGLN